MLTHTWSPLSNNYHFNSSYPQTAFFFFFLLLVLLSLGLWQPSVYFCTEGVQHLWCHHQKWQVWPPPWLSSSSRLHCISCLPETASIPSCHFQQPTPTANLSSEQFVLLQFYLIDPSRIQGSNFFLCILLDPLQCKFLESGNWFCFFIFLVLWLRGIWDSSFGNGDPLLKWYKEQCTSCVWITRPFHSSRTLNGKPVGGAPGSGAGLGKARWVAQSTTFSLFLWWSLQCSLYRTLWVWWITLWP